MVTMFSKKKDKPVKPYAPSVVESFGLPMHYAPTSANPGVSAGAGIANSYTRFNKQTTMIGILAAPRMVDIMNVRGKR